MGSYMSQTQRFQPFEWTSEVRDYELDAQGIVNNANYLHYFEHARHLYLRELGVDVLQWAERGYRLVMVQAEIKFKASLQSGDRFVIDSAFSRTSPLRFSCVQHLLREPGCQLVAEVQAVVTCVNSDTQKPELPAELLSQLGLE